MLKGNNKEDGLAVGLAPLPTWLLLPLCPQSSIFVSRHPENHYASWDTAGIVGNQDSLHYVSFEALNAPCSGVEVSHFGDYFLGGGSLFLKSSVSTCRAAFSARRWVAGGQSHCQGSFQSDQIVCTAVNVPSSGRQPCLDWRRAALSF